MYKVGAVLVVFVLLHSAFCDPCPEWQVRNYNQIRKIYDNVQYPKNIEIIANGPPPGLFAQNVSGRINPIGNFTDIKGLVEYFYALTPAVTNNLIGAALGELVIVGFSSMCAEVAAFSGYVPICIYNKASQTCGSTVGYIAQQGFFKFNTNGEVAYYDLVLESFNEVMTILFGDQTLASTQFIIREQICLTAAANCTGDNLQYDSLGTCLILLGAKTYGTFWDAWSDTVACRLLHALLALARKIHSIVMDFPALSEQSNI